MVEPPPFLVLRIDDGVQHDRRRAEMRHPLVGDRIIDRPRGDIAAAHHRGAQHWHQPDVIPVVAVKQRHDGQIPRIARQFPTDDRAHGHQIRAAMMVNHPLGPPRGARGIVERKALPFILGHDPFEIRIARGQKILIAHMIAVRMHARLVIGNLDHTRRRAIHDLDGPRQHRQELRIAQHHTRLPVIEDIGDRIGLQPGVDRVENSTTGGHAEMRLAMRRQIRQKRGHHIAGPDAQPDQRRGQPRAALVILGIGLTKAAIHHRFAVRKNSRSPTQMRERRQRHEIRRTPLQPGLILHPAHRALPDSHPQVRRD